MEIIAYIKSDFSDKFGIPRQSGMVDNKAQIIFTPKYKNPEALRGLSDFNYIWLLWDFSLAHRENWSPTVRPPVLGGNQRMGVFATRSPFRPNNIGLSSVKLLNVVLEGEDAPYLEILGADLLDKTPILDIKPYIRSDCHIDAKEGFNVAGENRHLQVEFPKLLLDKFPKEKQREIIKILSLDPRPSYQEDPNRSYGLSYAGFNLHFKVEKDILTVQNVLFIQN